MCTINVQKDSLSQVNYSTSHCYKGLEKTDEYTDELQHVTLLQRLREYWWLQRDESQLENWEQVASCATGSMKKSWKLVMSWFYCKRSHSCTRMTFCWMSDYNIMNQIYFICRKKMHFMRNQRSKITSRDTETRTTLSEKNTSLPFKQAPYELFSLYRTKVMIIFSGGSMPKKYNPLWFLHSCTTETAWHRVLKFCKNTIAYGVYKLKKLHWNLRRLGCGLWWFGMEWLCSCTMRTFKTR
jgi:hypothetical protein